MNLFFPIWRPELEFDRGGREGREVMYVVGWWGNRREKGGGDMRMCAGRKRKQLSAASGRVVKYEIDKVTARYST